MCAVLYQKIVENVESKVYTMTQDSIILSADETE